MASTRNSKFRLTEDSVDLIGLDCQRHLGSLRPSRIGDDHVIVSHLRCLRDKLPTSSAPMIPMVAMLGPQV